MSEFTSGSPTIPLAWVEIPDLTFLIRRSQKGDVAAGARLLDLAYPFLKQIASRLLRDGALERPTGAAGFDSRCLADQDFELGGINDRGHYLASVTLAMKGQLIDHARRAKSMNARLPTRPGTQRR